MTPIRIRPLYTDGTRTARARRRSIERREQRRMKEQRQEAA